MAVNKEYMTTVPEKNYFDAVEDLGEVMLTSDLSLKILAFDYCVVA